MEKKVVLYSLPIKGHIVSMVELGKLLLTNSSTLSSITILIPHFPFIPLLNPYISSISSTFPSILFIYLPPIATLDLYNSSSFEGNEYIAVETFRRNNTNVLESLQSLKQSYTISAFIIDMFCYPAVEVSQSLNIPTFFFFTCGASVLGYFLNLPVYDRTYTGSYRELQVSLEVPGVFSFPTSHMIECMLDRGASYREFVKLAQVFLESDGIIVNTFESLEVKAVQGLKDGTILPGSRIPPVYSIGPLIANRSGGDEVGDGERHECLKWLDTQPNKSVVFLCFGTGGFFSKKQILEIAVGLEKSGVRFLWVVRAAPSDDSKVEKDFAVELHEPNLDTLLPKGFIDRTKDRGFLVKLWAPQIEILAHESVGAFVTHCGWNSILEAVCAGIPMVAWPLYAEQKFNKILIVEELEIALPMDESLDNRFVSSNEIEKKVKQIMSSKEGDAIRKRVIDLKNEARIAFTESGSSTTMLTMLIESLK